MKQEMIPSIYTLGTLNQHINYTFDQLLQVKAQEPQGEPIECSRDRCWNKKPKQFVGDKPHSINTKKFKPIQFPVTTDMEWVVS